MEKDLRLMAVHAHPDDESSKGAASTAKYVHEGIDVLVVSCTGGESGSVLNPSYPDQHPSDIAALRRVEMANAQQILGVQHRWLGFVDSGMDEPLPAGSFAVLPVAEEAPLLAKVIREFRPHVVTTYDENGGYPHPDHIRTHEITVAAIELASDPTADVIGAPWQVQKLYYHHSFSRTRVIALHEASLAAGRQSPYEDWLKDWPEERDTFKRITTRVHCSEYFPVRDSALRAHATQVDPNGAWFAVDREIEAVTWPTEDFELVWSKVRVDTPEADLFQGLR
jgi:mycothiol S-conjugate amidase